jgi:hypothetical protein
MVYKMGKGYYIFGGVLLGIGALLLFNRIKKGNLKLNYSNEDVSESEEGVFLEPPMEVINSGIPPLATPTFV